MLNIYKIIQISYIYKISISEIYIYIFFRIYIAEFKIYLKIPWLYFQEAGDRSFKIQQTRYFP